jgi:hypothetical protein
MMEYDTAMASVMVLVWRHRGRNTMEIHAGRLPRFTACKIWLCVKGRNGMGPAAATATLALAARDAPDRERERRREMEKRRCAQEEEEEEEVRM